MCNQYGKLTHREREVLRLVCLGNTSLRIAAALGISRGTAVVHVSSAMRKLRAATRVQAAVIYARCPLCQSTHGVSGGDYGKL